MKKNIFLILILFFVLSIGFASAQTLVLPNVEVLEADYIDPGSSQQWYYLINETVPDVPPDYWQSPYLWACLETGVVEGLCFRISRIHTNILPDDELRISINPIIKSYKYVEAGDILSIYEGDATIMLNPFPGEGDGSKENPYEITSWGELDNMRYHYMDDLHFILMNDLNSQTHDYDEFASPSANGGMGWFPIRLATGGLSIIRSFDGQNNVISDFFINGSTFENGVNYLGGDYKAALFDSIRNASITNLGLENVTVIGVEDYFTSTAGLVATSSHIYVDNCYISSSTITGTNEVGGLLGDVWGFVINNSYSDAVIYSTGWGAGGLVGGIWNAPADDEDIILNSYATGNVYGFEAAGGLVGGGDARIENSYATGNVYGAIDGGYGVGGLVGSFYTGPYDPEKSVIVNSYATGNVRGYDGVGGLAGDFWGLAINNSYATGNVRGERYSLGGLVGDMEGDLSYSYATGDVLGGTWGVGGLVGGYYVGTMSNSFAKGKVTSNKDSVGGLAGYIWSGADVVYSYATGNVVGENEVGGLVGYNDGGAISFSYSAGRVNGFSDVGGLVGYNDGIITSSFYDSDIAEQTDTGKGEPRTTTEMKQLSTYSDWDIAPLLSFDGETVFIDEDEDYPLLGILYGLVFGCKNPSAINYNESVNVDDGSCIFKSDYSVWREVSLLPIHFLYKFEVVPTITYTAVAVHEHNIYVFGGAWYNDALNTTFIYDINTDEWTKGAESPVNIIGGSANYFEGNIYVTGQEDNPTSIWVYDVLSDSWSQGAEFPVYLRDTAVNIHNGKIYVVGGSDEDWEASNELWIYDILSDSWIQGADVPEPVQAQYGLGIIDNKIYYAGGNDEAWDFVQNLYVYDIEAESWENKGQIPQSVSYGALASLGQYFYMVGGFLDDSWDDSDLFQRYDTVTESWETLPSFPYHISEVSGVATSEDTIWLIGVYAAEANADNSHMHNRILFAYTLPSGCTDLLADNYDPEAVIDDGTCYRLGCTDPEAVNYKVWATLDDGSCTYPPPFEGGGTPGAGGSAEPPGRAEEVGRAVEATSSENVGKVLILAAVVGLIYYVFIAQPAPGSKNSIRRRRSRRKR